MTELTELLERLEKATGPSRGLDGRIAWALGWRFNGGLGPTDHDWDEWPDCAGCWHQPGDVFPDINNKVEYRKGFAEGRWNDPPEWSSSIDAALALVERQFPGSQVGLDPIFFVDPIGVKWDAILCTPHMDRWNPVNSDWIARVEARHADRRLAILAALLKALIAQVKP